GAGLMHIECSGDQPRQGPALSRRIQLEAPDILVIQGLCIYQVGALAGYCRAEHALSDGGQAFGCSAGGWNAPETVDAAATPCGNDDFATVRCPGEAQDRSIIKGKSPWRAAGQIQEIEVCCRSA